MRLASPPTTRKHRSAAVICDLSVAEKAMENEDCIIETPLTAARFSGSENGDGDSDEVLNIVGEVGVKQIKICCFIFGALFGFYAQIPSIRNCFLTMVPWSQLRHADDIESATTASTCLIDDGLPYAALMYFTLFVKASCFLVICVRHLFYIVSNRWNKRKSALEKRIFQFESHFILGASIAVAAGFLRDAFLLEIANIFSIVVASFLIVSFLLGFWKMWLIFVVRRQDKRTTTMTRKPLSRTILLV